MQVKDINYCMEMVGPNDNLQQAAEKMRYLDVGAMPVCDGNRLVGVETDILQLELLRMGKTNYDAGGRGYDSGCSVLLPRRGY